MRKPSAALIIALVSLFVALGGAGMAATGVNFILGKANSATSTTSLSAPIPGKTLQLSNTSTSAGATALGLNVASGHPAFTVNTVAKIPYLNADKLDGIDSRGFVQGDDGLRVRKFEGSGVSSGTQILSFDGLQLTYRCTADALFLTATTTVNGASIWVGRTYFNGATVDNKLSFNIGDKFSVYGFVGTGVYTAPGGVVVTFNYESSVSSCAAGVAGTAYGG